MVVENAVAIDTCWFDKVQKQDVSLKQYFVTSYKCSQSFRASMPDS